MAKPKSAWGIDIGQCALKALKLRMTENEGFQVEAFDMIEHPTILSQPDVDRRGLIHAALEQFLSRNSVSGSVVAVSVPGQTSFTRFVKLPPVETKRIPEIVRFEASQQIPFPIDEVIWRWQTFQDPDSPDIEVGIFAMKRSDVARSLEHFDEIDLGVDIVQMAPLALYNFMQVDEQTAQGGATLLADVGADKTDLVVSDGARIWTRTVQIGGNNFTETLVRAFKLSFPKAETLKTTAATSKYARQIFQAMRPVFADLVQEIQRSIGYYTSLHREARFKRLLGLGNGFRLPGLQKFLEQNLNMPVVRADSFNRLAHSDNINVPSFTENALSFAVAYGLAAQGLGETPIATNLLPQEVARGRLWRKKRAWFAAAAACILVALGGPVYSSFRDSQLLGSSDATASLTKARKVAEDFHNRDANMKRLAGERQKAIAEVDRYKQLFAYRDFWPSVESLLTRSIQEVAEDQTLLDLYQTAKTDAERAARLEKIKLKARSDRRYFVVEQRRADYYANILDAPTDLPGIGAPAARPPGGGQAAGAQRGFRIILTGRTPMTRDLANERLAALTRKSDELAKGQYGATLTLIDSRFGLLPQGAAPAGSDDAGPPSDASVQGAPKYAEVPDESWDDDTRFVIVWRVAIVAPAPQPAK